MNSRVIVDRAMGTTHNPTTDDTTVERAVLYDGMARIQQQGARATTNSAGQPLVGHGYLVQLDWSELTPGVAIPIGARVLVTGADNDPDLVDAELWVVNKPRGSEMWSRDLTCSDNQADVAAT